MELSKETYNELKLSGLSRAQIADIFELPEWKLKKLISINHWGTEKPVLDNIKAFADYNEYSCYWGGFLAADGNVDSKNRIRLMLKYDDISHLEKFKDFLKSTHKISVNTTTYNRCSFEFTNVEMCEDLDLNFNIVPTKTNILKFPKSIPQELMRHFIRGYFDGDGSICESFSNKNSIMATMYATISCGSEQFIVALYEYITNILCTNGHLQKFTDSNKWQIKYNTNDAKVLLKYMYYNSNVYLDRKYNLYNKLIIENNRLTRDKGIVHTQ
jgi:hypothetical protein